MVQIPDKQSLIEVLFPEDEEDFPLLRRIIDTLYEKFGDRSILPPEDLGTTIGESICGNGVTGYHTFENLLWLILEAIASVTLESIEWSTIQHTAMRVIYSSQSRTGEMP